MKAFSVQAFIQDKREVISITSPDKELVRYEQDAGQALADFLYADFAELRAELEGSQNLLKQVRQGKNAQVNKDKLLNLGERLTKAHIYLSPLERFLRQTLQEDPARMDVKYLSHKAYELREEQANIRILLEECLDADAPDSSEAMEKYALAVKQGHFQTLRAMPHTLRCSSITTEAVVDEAEGVQFLDVLNPGSVFDLMDFARIYLLRNGILFRKCKNCGRYFPLTGNSNGEYCGRVIAGSKKTCREMGAVRVYQHRKFSNPVEKVYNKVYKTRNARIRAGKITKEEFSDWAVEARKMRDRCLKGEINLEDFECWLKTSS